MCEFQELIAECELTDPGCIGPRFTWWNNREEKILLVNGAWNSEFTQSYASFEANGISDHIRSWIKIEDVIVEKRRHFQFFNYLADHPQFKDVVSQYWEGTEALFHSRSALRRLHKKKLKGLTKQLLRALNRERYGDITRRTKIAFDVLCERQKQALHENVLRLKRHQ
ncbi:unnamed protein product [Arabis nemorensis]|uniref:Uncharacterized protein n=1 Tax=Arabis nemorensis TaxID=586526 RepID=A0A565CMM1_9BRAS|nr:unnamed protein product [Arabis nemorensis]